jgi:peptidyl-dipeptidase A
MISVRAALVVATGVLALLWIARPAASADVEATDKARQFLENFSKQFRPLDIACNRAWWDANITGKDEDFKRQVEAQNKLDEFLSQTEAFAEVKALKRSGGIDDPVIKRAIDIVYLKYLEKQVEPDLLRNMSERSSKVDQKFNTFRAKVGGKELTTTEVRNVLKDSTLSERRQEVWEASKEVGKLVEPDLKELVRARNQAAKQLGFDNYHALKLFVDEQNGKEVVKLFDRLDELTREPFARAKAEIDAQLAKNCNVKPDELMPWHYHDLFFQESPSVFKADLDKVYAEQDIVKLCADFYRGIGLPIDLPIERSNNDFRPAKGKNPHAYCIDITRDGGDVRVLANVDKSDYWMSTMLHEFGHSVYSSINIPAKLPYVLRTEAHTLTTEGVAMMFEKLSKRRAWHEQMGVKIESPKDFDETGAKMQRYSLLIFSRWCQVMLRFEKSMYEDPEQDLNKRWWDLVEKFQMLRRPSGRNAPDYATKIHIVSAPVYYHNYMMGELFASQLHHAIARKVYKGADPATVVYAGNKEVGEFMKRYVFEPGKTMNWNELTAYATDAELSPEAFANDFSDKKE